MAILQPRLVIPIGTLAIEQVLGESVPLVEVIGSQRQLRYCGLKVDVICLPHPSGASPWHKLEPGKSLLHRALGLIAVHPEVRRTFPASRRGNRSAVV